MNIHASSSASGPLRWALSGALFPLFFELGEVVALQLATAPLPLPDAPVAEVVAYYGGTAFYARLFDIPGQRHPGARQYFQCGSVIVAVIDPTQGGMAPTPGPKSLYFAVRDVHAVHQRAAELNALAPYSVHGEAAAEILKRPWGERSFYVVDPWGNDLCFVEEGTLYT